MRPTVRSQIVIVGPRPVVSVLVLILEAEELGRTPGSPPLPLDPPANSASSRRHDPAAPPTSRTTSVVGPTIASIDAGVVDARYTVVAERGLARAVAELAVRVPEITVVLTEQARPDRTHLTVYRSARRIAALDCASAGLLILPARPHTTLQDCIIQADHWALATGSLQAFVAIDDVAGKETARYDASAWHRQTLRCADGTKLTVAYPDPEAWTAHMVLTRAEELASLLELPRTESSPLDVLPAVFGELLPYGLVGRNRRQLHDIAALACAWAARRAVDSEVERAVEGLCRRLPSRAVAEAALGSDGDALARRAVDEVVERLASHQPALCPHSLRRDVRDRLPTPLGSAVDG
jgi:hypothetical protein